MSIIVASGQQISNSPLNHSKTKQMFSFGKAERFPKIRSSGYSGVFYNLPEVRMSRYTTLGKGNKSDFTAGAKNKSPVFYEPKSDFDQAHPHSPRYTFGLGRDKFAKAYCEGTKMFDKDIPGPGKYTYLKPFGSDACKFSIKGKHNRAKSVEMKSTPGPGEYKEMIQINKAGKFPSSKFENIHEVNFGADKSKRFVYSYNKNPGPSEYNIKPLFGMIFDSRYRSNPPKSISFKWKNIDSRSNYPGPGQYRAFSEFGIYESKTARESEAKEK